MTVEEIFSELGAHLVKGLMVHNQMMCYYDFLNLEGYAKCHKYHYIIENKTYVKMLCHYSKYHGKLIKDKKVDDPDLIPKSWYQYEKKDVDVTTKRNAVKSGMEKWLEWEEDTLVLYKKLRAQLGSLDEWTDVALLDKMICDVTEELIHIKKWYIDKKMTDFEIGPILSEQKSKKKKYKEKIHHIDCECYCGK